MSTTIPNQYAAREVRAAFRIGTATIPVNQITLTHTIDELPYASVSVQLDNEGDIDPVVKRFGSVAMNLDKFNALTKATQEKILNGYKVEPDTELIIRDGEFKETGDGHELLLKGFLGRPEFRIREGDVFLSYSLVHAKAVMQALNTRIYGAQEHYTFTVPRSFFDLDTEGGRVIKANSVADRIRIMLNGMVDRATSAFLPNLNDPSQYDGLPIHNLNRTVLPKVIDFLQLSSKTTEIADIGEPNFVNDNLLWTLWNTLLDSPNFFQAIAEFNAEFMFQMNADYEGSAWMEWSQVNTDSGEREIRVPIQNVVFSMANIFQLPILQVIIQANAMDLYAFTGNIGMNEGEQPLKPVPMDSGLPLQNAIVATGDVAVQLTGLTRWPPVVPRNAIGALYFISPPSWLNPELVTYGTSANLQKLALDPGTRLTNWITATLALKDEMTGAAATRNRVMTYMAKQQFKKLYLEGTTAQITIPLNLRVRPGYTYLVASVTGETLFTGYLVNVVHEVQMSQEGGATATSSLSFSHIKAPGVVINSLEDPPKFITAKMALPSAFTGDAVISSAVNQIA